MHDNMTKWNNDIYIYQTNSEMQKSTLKNGNLL